MLPAGPLLTAFLLASLVLAITPGPGVVYIVTRSIAQGWRAGVVSVAGVAVGNLGNAIGASLGLAALFAISAAAFSITKYAGAAYLLGLGFRALRPLPASTPTENPPPVRLPRLFADGALVALLNPKTAVFFAAFLPQFMAPGAPLLQSLILGVVFVAIAATTDTLYALTAGTLAPALTRTSSLQTAGRYLSGGVLIGLGLLAALAPPQVAD